MKEEDDYPLDTFCYYISEIPLGLLHYDREYLSERVYDGSWKDPESFVRSAWRTWEYQNQPRSYIGFRCVRSLANSTSTKQKKNKK